MTSRHQLPEPPSVVNSESGYLVDTESVVLNKIGGSAHYKKGSNPQQHDSLFRNFRLNSLTSLSSWITNINEYVEKKREHMLSNTTEARVDELERYGAEAGCGFWNETAADAISIASTRNNHNFNAEKKILKPYANILKLLGMRNIGSPDNPCHRMLSAFWTIIVFCVIVSGYTINIVVCRVNSEKMGNGTQLNQICRNKSLTYNYIEGMCRSSLESILPSAIHFVAFLYSFWIFKITESEQVEALVQKALVGSGKHTCTNSEMRKSTFINRLKVVYSGGYICLALLFILTIINSYCGKSLLWWKCTPVDENTSYSEIQSHIDHYYKGLLVAVPSFVIFIFLCPILLNFIIQGRLIGYLVLELRETLREKRNTLKAIMQEAHDISTILHKMNSESSPAMSFILFYLAYGLFVDVYSVLETVNDAKSLENIFSNEGCYFFTDQALKDTCMTVKLFGRISFVVVIMRDIVLGLMFCITIYEGCRIATSFKRLVNQTLEIRVFGYNQTDTAEELDSFHYYIRALRMRAKLFQYPMETKHLLFPAMLLSLGFLCFDVYFNVL